MSNRAWERQAVVAYRSGSATTTPLETGGGVYVDCSKFQRVLAIFILGDMPNETVDCEVYNAADASGTSEAALKSATQLAASASANDNKVVVIDIAKDEISATLPFLAARVTTSATGGSSVGILLLGYDPKHGAMDDLDNAGVVEIKT